MKRFILGMIVMVICAGGSAAYANEGHDGKHLDKKLEKMKTALNLTAEQEAQIKAVFTDYNDRATALRKEKHDKLAAILTPEQREKHETSMKERKEKWEKKRAERKDKKDEDDDES